MAISGKRLAAEGTGGTADVGQIRISIVCSTTGCVGVSGAVVHADQNRGQYVRPLGGSQIVENGLDENPFTGGEQGKWVYTLSRC
jgi:hypothetical protein